MKLWRRRARGFTLVETLVAILILSLAIAGPLTIAARGLGAALVAKDKTTALFLAQDALEYVHFAVDTNRLKGGSWISGSGSTNLSPCESASGCNIDSINMQINSCGGSCSELNYDSASNEYTYGSGSATPFYRAITITETVPNVEMVASTTVWWHDIGNASVIHSVTLTDRLFNWQ